MDRDLQLVAQRRCKPTFERPEDIREETDFVIFHIENNNHIILSCKVDAIFSTCVADRRSAYRKRKRHRPWAQEECTPTQNFWPKEPETPTIQINLKYLLEKFFKIRSKTKENIQKLNR